MAAVVVSACLTGLGCRYDGRRLGPDYQNRLTHVLASIRPGALVVPVCPEQLGGLPTPRPAGDIRGGNGFDVLAGRARVETDQGRDLTAEFKAGAEAALKLARSFGADRAVLKARSPSCGFCPATGSGPAGVIGVTAALLSLGGIEVVEL